MIEGISAITLATHDMRRAVRFYRVLGFAMLYGGEVGRSFARTLAPLDGTGQSPAPPRLRCASAAGMG
jgi:catechol 2,3-dioxygenase-like lactoylglutathione lyase family enzyme